MENLIDTKPHTFIDIFNTEYTVQGIEEKVKLTKILIPLIQRDYAQGRTTFSINRTRERFLDALYNAVTEKPITLDFVYGSIDANGVLTPLDGQQRLTTLFLLHWYAAKKGFIHHTECDFLKNFSYETRYSARQFCEELCDYEPTFVEEELKNEIIEQSWFPLDWKKDATISSMLVMLTDIDKKFSDIADTLWEKLKNGAVTFYFLPLEDMGMTDDLYIKMNSRGKPLTSFEHFKAELERNLTSIDKTISQRIMRKIDIDWTDMLWPYKGDNNIIDDEFLRYFVFICDIICYKQGETPISRSNDEFDLLKLYFEKNVSNVKDNIELFEKYFDIWVELQKQEKEKNSGIENFFNRFISKQHESGKVKIDSRYDIDIFGKCLNSYCEVLGNKKRQMPLARLLFLYAVTVYLIHKEKISEELFVQRLRIVNNLIQNSPEEMSDNPNRDGGNRIPTNMKMIDSIIINGVIDESIGPNFSLTQLIEEKDKLDWLKKNEDKREILNRLEDHELLFGQIGVIGLENFNHFERFESLFKCDLDNIDCALLSVGNYMQADNNWRYQLGSKSMKTAWTNLFHKAKKDSIKRVLNELLAKAESFDNKYLISLKKDFISGCKERKKYDWRYYYVSYDSFRLGRYGKYKWDDFKNAPYDFIALYGESQLSSRAYNVFLNEIGEVYPEDLGRSIIIDEEHYVTEYNDKFVYVDWNTNEVLKECLINQNEFGIDTEDRIVKGKKWIKKFINSAE
ncbi:MAG TPA: DUF262 domain-containing protein [Spirochaetota bacterium]|nr:DUF262 domain-containing protein [Spirochaetota bacterium]